MSVKNKLYYIMKIKEIIKKIYLEIYTSVPSDEEIKKSSKSIKKHGLRNFINSLISMKHEKDMKKYKNKYKTLKSQKTTEYEFIQISKQFKEILDKKNEEIRRLKQHVIPITPFRSYDYENHSFELPL